MDRYKLNSGVFPIRFSDLDVSIPNTTTCDGSGNIVRPTDDCMIGNYGLVYWMAGPNETSEGGLFQIRDWKHQMTLEWTTSNSTKNCIAYTPIAQKTCIALGGKYIQEYYLGYHKHF
jgi:hypothetical protein